MKTLLTLLGMLVFGSILAQDKIYLHQATPSNISGHVTYIDHPDLNGNPNAPIVFSQNFNGNGLGGRYNDNPVGLVYDAGFDGGRWAVFNENLVAMPGNAKFNIFIADDSEVYTHIATPANTTTYLTTFNIPAITHLSYVFFNSYYTPNAVFNPHPYGTNTPPAGERGLYAEDINSIPEGAAFKVMRATPTSARLSAHTSTAANITDHYTVIDHPELNGNPTATFLYAHYYGFGSEYNVIISSNTGILYTGTHWAIFNQDFDPFPEGAFFDIVIADQEVLSTSNFEQVQATLFPNPASDIINVQANSGLQKIIIHNLLGQEVFKQNLENTTATLDVSTLSSGQYIATITTQNGVANQKFIKK